MPDSEDTQAFQRLAIVRSAKSHFLAGWLRDASDRLALDDETRMVLDRIADETRNERDRLERVMERWNEPHANRRSAASNAREVERLALIDFLQTSMEAKTAAGETLERAADLAPRRLQDAIFELAAIDFRHANLLREQLHKEYLKRPIPGRSPRGEKLQD